MKVNPAESTCKATTCTLRVYTVLLLETLHLNNNFMFLYSALLLKHELSKVNRKTTSGLSYLHDIESDNYVNNANVPMAFGCQIFTPLTVFWFLMLLQD